MSLPLKARVAIRDLWDKPEAPAPTAMKKVKEILGIDVRCVPEWNILMSELDRTYEDKATLVGFVVTSLQVWFETMAVLLEDESLDPWPDRLLDRIQEVSHVLRVVVEVCDGQDASTHFSKLERGFVVSLPSTEVNPPTQFAPVFKDQILNSAEDDTTRVPSGAGAGGGDWAYVGSGAESVADSAFRPQVPATAGPPDVEYLPDPAALPKPGTLLLKPPYHLFIRAHAPNNLEIQCSHTPTLDVLFTYLKRWCRVNPNITDRPPAMAIAQNTTTCSFGLPYDTLTVSSESRYGNGFTASPTLVLALVEGTLGYRRVFSDASSWQYRKDTPFKIA